MKTVLEFCAVLMVGVAPHLAGAFLYIRRPDAARPDSALLELAEHWRGAMASILVVMLIALSQPEGLASIGIHPGNTFSNLSANFVGLLAFSVFGWTVILGRLVSRRKLIQKIDGSRPDVATTLIYSRPLEKIAFLTTLPVIVFAEEVTYRGYLVLRMASLTGTWLPWAALSVALSVVIHLYQGRTLSVIAWHLCFAGLSVGLVIVTRNIAASLGYHLILNLVGALRIWVQVKPDDAQAVARASGRGTRLALLGLITANLIMISYAPFRLFFP